MSANISTNNKYVITSGANEQALTFLIALMTCLIFGFIYYLLKLVWNARNEQIYKKTLRPRKAKQLIVSYVLILLSLFLQTTCLLCFYWVPIKTETRNTFSDGTPIYFTKEIDYCLHFLFWLLFLLFIHLKLYGLILQISECNNNNRNICNRFGYLLVILTVVIVIAMQIIIRTPIDSNKLSLNYEQTLLFSLAMVEFVFINWYFRRYFDDKKDTIYLRQQWNKIWWLFCIALLIWFIIFVICMFSININFLSLQLCITLFYQAWICLLCYVETKWIINKVNKHCNDEVSELSMMESIEINNIIRDKGDEKEVHDILMDSIDTIDYGEDNEFKVDNDIELSLIIENRKKQKKQKQKQTKYGDQVFGVQKQENNNNKNDELNDKKEDSDSDELYVANKKKKKQTRKTPKPPPKIGEKWNKLKFKNINNNLIDYKSDSDDMYTNHCGNKITTNGSTTRKESFSSDSDEVYENKANHNSDTITPLTVGSKNKKHDEKKQSNNKDNNEVANITTKTVEGEDDGAV